MRDEILEEVWRVRDAFAKRHDYNLDAMVAELQEMERHSLNPVVDRGKQEPDKEIQSDDHAAARHDHR